MKKFHMTATKWWTKQRTIFSPCPNQGKKTNWMLCTGGELYLTSYPRVIKGPEFLESFWIGKYNLDWDPKIILNLSIYRHLFMFKLKMLHLNHLICWSQSRIVCQLGGVDYLNHTEAFTERWCGNWDKDFKICPVPFSLKRRKQADKNT